jgi:hypothetical protein
MSLTVIDVATFCCQTVGDTSSDMLNFAKNAIRLKYSTLYDGHAWRESMRVINVITDPNLGGVFFIPLDTEEVVFCKFSRDGINFQRLMYRERDWVERTTGGNAYAPYRLPMFYRAENYAWPYVNPGILTLTTTELTAFAVHIEGLDANGNGVQDDFTLVASLASDGITVIPASVQTVNTYSSVLMFSKGQGKLSVTAAQPSANPMTIQVPYQVSELVFSQFVIYPNPTLADDVTGVLQPCYLQLQVKLKADVLANDMSVPRLSHIWDCLTEYTLSSLYTRARQLAKADAREQKAIAHFQAAIAVEKQQSEFRQQAFPTVYESGDYLNSLGWRPTSTDPWGWGWG